MKKFLPVFMILFCFSVIAPIIKAQAQDYDGPVFKNRIPENRENRGVYFRHDSVKWGGKKLAWGSYLSIRFRDHYSKSSPRVFIRDKTTRLISNNRARKRY